MIATYGAQVVDTFYVKDMFGLKLHQKPKQEALEKQAAPGHRRRRGTGGKRVTPSAQSRHEQAPSP